MVENIVTLPFKCQSCLLQYVLCVYGLWRVRRGQSASENFQVTNSEILYQKIISTNTFCYFRSKTLKLCLMSTNFCLQPTEAQVFIIFLIQYYSARTVGRQRPGPRFEPETGGLEAVTLTTRPPLLLVTGKFKH